MSFFYLISVLSCVCCFIGIVEALVPQPIITLHDGHIGLYDSLMETQYTGTVVAGRPYTLDIYMGNTDQYDYVIDHCTYNHRQTFIDRFGCLQNNNIFLQKWETDQYATAGAIKRTLVHLIAEESILFFECQIKVLECCGCAEQSCERRPSISQYPIHPMPLTCCNNLILPPPSPPIFVSGRKDWFGLLPWWLWIFFLLLLLFLLTAICCLLACCMAARKKNKVHANKPVIPIQQQLPSIFRVDKVAQTVPEHRQISQQTSFDNYNLNNRYKESNHLQFDDHASISLNDQRLMSQEMRAGGQKDSARRDGARAYVAQPASNFVHPFHSSPYLNRLEERREHWEEEVEEYNEESVIDTTTHYENYPTASHGENLSSIRRIQYAPVHRFYEPPIGHRQVQREQEERCVRQPRSRSHEIITERREEEFQETRSSPEKGIYRGQIQKTMRQSSAI